MKNKNYIISVVFLVIIFTISILTVLTNNTKELISQSIGQVRESNYPSLSLKLKALSSKLESTYNEHIIFKRKIVMPTNIVDYKVFNKIDSKAALLGKDNWLFYKTDYDGNPIEDYKGTNAYSEEQLKQITKNVKDKQDELKQKNIKFYMFMPPNKEQVYSNYMPADIKVINEDKKSDKLIRYLKENNINVIDPKKEILQMKDNFQVYYKNDTHWNKLGSFIGTQLINQEVLGERETFQNDKVISEGKAQSSDLLDILEMSKYNDDIEYNYLSKNSNVDVKYEIIDQNIDEYTSNAKSDIKVLVIGDSFRTLLKSWMPLYYSKVDFVHRSYFKSEMIEKLQPDVVIYEIVERKTDELLTPIS